MVDWPGWLRLKVNGRKRVDPTRFPQWWKRSSHFTLDILTHFTFHFDLIHQTSSFYVNFVLKISTFNLEISTVLTDWKFVIFLSILILFRRFDVGHWLFSSNKGNIGWYLRLQSIYRALVGWRLHRWNANMYRPCGPSSGQITEVVDVKCSRPTV